MIIICVVYCWMLNRRIQDLQNSRVEFARMIKELNASIIKAEANVNEMSELSKVTSAEIRFAVDEAKENIVKLTNINQIALDISRSLSEQAKGSHHQQGSKMGERFHDTTINSESNDRFSEDDLMPESEQEKTTNYANNLKNFIQNVVTKKTETNQSLNQMSYYDTLRKINAKK